MDKTRERARLLKAYKRTGDKDYLRAAECLHVPLRDHLQQMKLFRRGRGAGTAGRAARPRLYRMHRLIAAGATVHAAACQEVAEYGQEAHASDAAAIDYLRARYVEDRESIAAVVAAEDRIRARCQVIDKQYAAIVDLYRTAQQAFPSPPIHQIPAWIGNIGSILQLVRHPLSWRNTRSKNAENISND
jgi:hypothetical protein